MLGGLAVGGEIPTVDGTRQDHHSEQASGPWTDETCVILIHPTWSPDHRTCTHHSASRSLPTRPYVRVPRHGDSEALNDDDGGVRCEGRPRGDRVVGSGPGTWHRVEREPREGCRPLA